jgi:hypothetical protein
MGKARSIRSRLSKYFGPRKHEVAARKAERKAAKAMKVPPVRFGMRYDAKPTGGRDGRTGPKPAREDHLAIRNQLVTDTELSWRITILAHNAERQ